MYTFLVDVWHSFPEKDKEEKFYAKGTKDKLSDWEDRFIQGALAARLIVDQKPKKKKEISNESE